jgi:phosphopantothenoylcysteine synthetase/decarboxylase
MTRSAKKFVGPTTFQALTGRAVLTSLWSAADPDDVQHIALTGAADLVLIAPATANIIGKIAAGIADDVVTTLVISAASPVVLAPAMNDRMWANPVVQENVSKLKRYGFTTIGPGEGWLACRSIGPGRMAETSEILERIAAKLKIQPPKRR